MSHRDSDSGDDSESESTSDANDVSSPEPGSSPGWRKEWVRKSDRSAQKHSGEVARARVVLLNAPTAVDPLDLQAVRLLALRTLIEICENSEQDNAKTGAAKTLLEITDPKAVGDADVPSDLPDLLAAVEESRKLIESKRGIA